VIKTEKLQIVILIICNLDNCASNPRIIMGFEHCKTLRWRLELWWTRSLTNETVLTAQQSETGPVILSVLLDPRQFFWSFAPSTNTIVLFNWINETQFFLDSSGRGICKKKCQFQLEHWRSVQVVKGALPGQNEKTLLLFDGQMSWSNNWASPQNYFRTWEKGSYSQYNILTIRWDWRWGRPRPKWNRNYY